MTSKQNISSGSTTWFAVIDKLDGKVAVLEGRPALYDDHESAINAVKRTSRPDRHEVDQVRIERVPVSSAYQRPKHVPRTMPHDRV